MSGPDPESEETEAFFARMDAASAEAARHEEAALEADFSWEFADDQTEEPGGDAVTEEDQKRYADAEVVEFSIEEFRRQPRLAFQASSRGKLVIVRDTDGSICMRMSPEFD